MNRRIRHGRIAAAVCALALGLAAPAGAQADSQATAVEILSYGYDPGSYSLVSGRLATTRQCRRARTVKYLLDQEGDGSFRLADVGRSTRKGAFGLLAQLRGNPSLGVIKIVAEPKRVGNTRCARGVALGD